MKQVCSSKDLYINSNYIKHHIGNNHFTGQQQIVEYLKQGKCSKCGWTCKRHIYRKNYKRRIDIYDGW